MSRRAYVVMDYGETEEGDMWGCPACAFTDPDRAKRAALRHEQEMRQLTPEFGWAETHEVELFDDKEES